ncbi:hypothetical protein G9F32_12680 [Acinetobacter sp. 194]|uniref:hypothetical protein n=1 Tax=Acinetobacter shaoyimingii TaxID=2715164 RepID=UPI00140D4863|nr:hypothetical protein [Acinetobacter shaoyimingii]NHB58864.1 hypothetical protein [Acinetobacter shaoyimingii]
MILDFKEMQARKFDEVAKRIQHHPEDYVFFESVSDFYKADWLTEFPQGTTWQCTGLDDGAEQFYAIIEYHNRILKIDCLDKIEIQYEVRTF